MIANKFIESARAIINKATCKDKSEIVNELRDAAGSDEAFPTWVAAALSVIIEEDIIDLKFSIVNYIDIESVREAVVVAGFDSEVCKLVAKSLWTAGTGTKLFDAKWIVENGHEDLLFAFIEDRYTYYVTKGISLTAVKIGDPELLRSLIVAYGFEIVQEISRKPIVQEAIALLTEDEMYNFIKEAFQPIYINNHISSLFHVFGKDVTIQETLAADAGVNVLQIRSLVEEYDDEDIWKLIPPSSWAYIREVPNFTEEGVKEFIASNPAQIGFIREKHLSLGVFMSILEKYGLEDGVGELDKELAIGGVTDEMWDACVHYPSWTVSEAIDYLPNDVRIKHVDWMIEAIEDIELNA